MVLSAFGVEDGRLSKADSDGRRRAANVGATLTGAAAGGLGANAAHTELESRRAGRAASVRRFRVVNQSLRDLAGSKTGEAANTARQAAWLENASKDLGRKAVRRGTAATGLAVASGGLALYGHHRKKS